MIVYVGHVLVDPVELDARLAWVLALYQVSNALRTESGIVCVIVAGLYGAATVSRSILWVQAAPAGIALILLLLA